MEEDDIQFENNSDEEIITGKFGETVDIHIIPHEGLVSDRNLATLLETSHGTLLKYLKKTNLKLLEYSKGKYIISLAAISKYLESDEKRINE